MGAIEREDVLRGIGKNFLFDYFTQHMPEGDMAFLNTGGHIRRNHKRIVNLIAKFSSAFSGPGNRRHPLLPGGLDGF